MLHLPILRHGVPYRSLDVVRVPHHRTREPFVEISQANAGLIRRDLLAETQAAARAALAAIPVTRLLEMCVKAAAAFEHDTLPVGDARQTPDDYVQQLSATTGMPHVLVRRNMRKIAGVLTEMETVLRGPDARARSVDPRQRLRPAWRARDQLLPAHAVARHRAAEQLARRALALGAGDSAQDAAGPQARQRRAVDAVSADPGVHQCRRAGRGVQLLPGGSRRRRRNRAAHRPQHVLRRRVRGRRLRGGSAHRAARAGLQQDPDRQRSQCATGTRSWI